MVLLIGDIIIEILWKKKWKNIYLNVKYVVVLVGNEME